MMGLCIVYYQLQEDAPFMRFLTVYPYMGVEICKKVLLFIDVAMLIGRIIVVGFLLGFMTFLVAGSWPHGQY